MKFHTNQCEQPLDSKYCNLMEQGQELVYKTNYLNMNLFNIRNIWLELITINKPTN